MAKQEKAAEVHARARAWITRQRVEGLTQAEQQWLAQHLQTCTDCSEEESELDIALRDFRMPAVMAGNLLVRSTQLKVRARARDLTERESRDRKSVV